MIRTDDEAPYTLVVTKKGSDPRPFVLRNYPKPDAPGCFDGESNWSCADAARATAAAPTYFPAFVRDGHHYIDGAVGYDNPSLLLYHEILCLRDAINEKQNYSEAFNFPIDYIVSIGTGDMGWLPTPTGQPKNGLSRVFETVNYLTDWIADCEAAQHYMRMLAKSNDIPYFRFQS